MICCQVMRSRAKSSISNLPFIHHPQLDPKWFQTLKLIVAANLQHHSHTHTGPVSAHREQLRESSHLIKLRRKKRALFNCSGESCVLRCIIRPTLIAVNEINFQLINLFRFDDNYKVSWKTWNFHFLSSLALELELILPSCLRFLPASVAKSFSISFHLTFNYHMSARWWWASCRIVVNFAHKKLLMWAKCLEKLVHYHQFSANFILWNSICVLERALTKLTTSEPQLIFTIVGALLIDLLLFVSVVNVHSRFSSVLLSWNGYEMAWESWRGMDGFARLSNHPANLWASRNHYHHSRASREIKQRHTPVESVRKLLVRCSFFYDWAWLSSSPICLEEVENSSPIYISPRLASLSARAVVVLFFRALQRKTIIVICSL